MTELEPAAEGGEGEEGAAEEPMTDLEPAAEGEAAEEGETADDAMDASEMPRRRGRRLAACAVERHVVPIMALSSETIAKGGTL